MTPIILHHGIFGFGQIELGKFKFSYFNGIDDAFAGLGYPVIVSRVHPTGSIARRAAELKERILHGLGAQREAEKVVIFAHSLGGLDARYMIARLGMADRVAALVTLATPHRGSPYADWCLKHLGQRLGGLKLMEQLGIDVEAVHDLTLARCAQFNREIPDVAGVRYFSIGAARPPHRLAPFLIHSYRVIHECEGDNDGMVSLTSARWGEYLGDWPADHLHVVNRRFSVEVRNPTGDITPWYLRILDRLEREGLCHAPLRPA